MTNLTVRVISSAVVLGGKIRLARNPWQRFLGLMGSPSLAPGSGMLFPRTNAVHSFFMRYPIRLLFLDAEGAVLAVTVLHPWRIGPVVRKASYVLELPDTAATQTVQEGDRLIWEAVQA